LNRTERRKGGEGKERKGTTKTNATITAKIRQTDILG
jgi:hypothetical protein